MKIKAWIIHKLGGYTRQEWNDMCMGKDARNMPKLAVTHLHPQRCQAAYSYYVEPDTPEVRRAQETMARNELAKKIAFEMLDHGMIGVIKTVDTVQDRGPIRKYRMVATAWALDATQMPMYGGVGL